MLFLNKKTAETIPVTPLDKADLQKWLKKQNRARRNWVAATGFTAATGTLLALPDKNGAVERVLFGVPEDGTLYSYAALPARLGKNAAGYYIDKNLNNADATQICIGWALGCYRFDRYKKSGKAYAQLVWPENADKKTVEATTAAVALVRDLVNTPSNDMGPAELAAAAKKLAGAFKKTRVSVITGEELLKKNWPAVYEVGKGSPRKPRLIDLRWGDPKHPRVTLVGKGVCFDSGGLDIKPESAMLTMKKDMAGAAHVFGLARMIMAHNLPVNLRVLVPAVENATDGNSYRPGDIIKTRKGLTIEIGNTDAEGRLILADALEEASRENPALIVDFATLTGAARVALGPDLPALFCNDDATAEALLSSGQRVGDPLWRLPLWQPYALFLDSKIADCNNVGPNSFAGASVAALFLEKFVSKGIPWAHIDTFAWNPSAKPGRPAGGEALGMRAAFDMIRKKFGRK
ncbi:MAG: leucyl aminopeptidase family protein [Alphaproteobacteria bacterium]|nr:leucyl aminopeptidase family protein [Alphaproteobacteria bacterium]MDE2335959.1 leucyl aminopeptidase family protein [Alphaproteobacteria bacterium]